MDYFPQSDFTTAVPSCSKKDMSPDLLEMLNVARSLAGVPFVINSAYRSYQWEKDNGRDGSSSHTLGLAVDIKATSSRNRFLILDGLFKAGFKRIGIHKHFIHADIDPDKGEQVIWMY